MKTIITFILIFAACTTFLPNIQSILSQVLDVLRTWIPSVMDLMEEIVAGIHKYCTESLLKDVTRVIAVLTDLIASVVHLLQPAVSSYFEVCTDGLVALHNNCMGYTDEILQQILGVDGAALPNQVGTARNKLLSLSLFLFWMIMGVICISRLSYNKFFLLMSGTFLVHAFFGPVWCIRRLAFCIGVCLWIGSLVSSKPIPAAITVLIAFTLTGFRKWRKKVAMTTSTSHLLRSNENIEQRLDGIERKLDILVARVNTIPAGLPS